MTLFVQKALWQEQVYTAHFHSYSDELLYLGVRVSPEFHFPKSVWQHRLLTDNYWLYLMNTSQTEKVNYKNYKRKERKKERKKERIKELKKERKKERTN